MKPRPSPLATDPGSHSPRSRYNRWYLTLLPVLRAPRALKRQNNYLRDLVARHEAVIAQYQRQLPNFRPASPEAGPSGEGGAAASRDEGEGAHPGSALPPWILDAEQTTPLLSAYDVRIRVRCHAHRHRRRTSF